MNETWTVVQTPILILGLVKSACKIFCCWLNLKCSGYMIYNKLRTTMLFFLLIKFCDTNILMDQLLLHASQIYTFGFIKVT